MLLLLLGETALAQEKEYLSLDWCNQKARENYPLIRQGKLLSDASAQKIKNLDANYLPSVNLNAQATYQSDVTKLDISGLLSQFPIVIKGPVMPELSKDNYKVTLDVGQIIWDGGAISGQKNVEEKGLVADKQSVEVELYKLKERVNGIFFGVLTIQKNLEVLKLFKSELTERLKVVESGIANGAMLASNGSSIQAEIAKIKQQIIELEYGKKASLAMLSDYIGAPIADNILLQEPKTSDNGNQSVRPEIVLFNYHNSKLEAMESLVHSKDMPKITAFGQIGYGRPGLNMLKNEFANFYIVGAKISWNLWNWNQNYYDAQALKIQKDIVNLQKETFEKNIQIGTEKLTADLKKYQEMIELDNQIIEFKYKTSKTAESQFANGAITATDYLTELNAYTQAKINLENHKILLVKSRVDLETLIGNN
jgi:outer membrane protein TolC